MSSEAISARRPALAWAILSVVPFSAGCANVVVPPTAPADPRPVFLLDHGRHASLVLPASDSTMVRYSYGDWKYYAQMKTGVVEATGAILWPTRAGLGRRELSETPTPSGVRRAVRVGIEALYEVAVASERVEFLRARLDSLFNRRAETRLYNSAYDLEFVHHPRRYTFFHNSNRVVANWLSELGCRVGGLRLFSRWRVEADPGNDQNGR